MDRREARGIAYLCKLAGKVTEEAHREDFWEIVLEALSEERKVAKWLNIRMESKRCLYDWTECSNCGKRIKAFSYENYCSECGSRMEAQDDEVYMKYDKDAIEQTRFINEESDVGKKEKAQALEQNNSI